MSEQTGTTNNTDGATQAQPTFPPSVAELTILLQEVNKLFPPITEELADGRTRKGRQQRQQIAQRDAYIGALQAALSHAATVGRLHRETELVFESHQREYVQQQNQIAALQRRVSQSGPFMLIAFQLGLLIQRRPQLAKTRDANDNGHTVGFTIDRLRIDVFGDQQSMQITAPSMKPRSFTFDSNGNFASRDIERLVGFLTMAGYKIDPQHIKLVLSYVAGSEIYDRLSDRAQTLQGLGHVALMGVRGVLESELEDLGDLPAPDLGLGGMRITHITDGMTNPSRSGASKILREKPRSNDLLFGDKSYDMPYGGDLLG